MLKLKLLSFFVLFNIVQSGLSKKWHPSTKKWRNNEHIANSLHLNHDSNDYVYDYFGTDDYESEFSTHAPDVHKATPDDSNINDVSTTENNIVASTPTENEDSTTARPDAKKCPKGQSSFTIEDLIVMINHVAETELNIMASINDSFHDMAIQARDNLLHSFNDYNHKFIERPEHLSHVLADFDNSLQKIVVPLVRTANATLQELPVIDRTYNRLNNRTTRILKDLENYKNICKWNCKQQYRSYLAPSQFLLLEDFIHRNQPNEDTMIENNEMKDLKTDNDGDFCSTIENVYKTILERLMAFEQEEKENLQKEIVEEENIFKGMIELLKKQLKDAAVSEFGTIMYDILSLFDDYFHSVKNLNDFNKQPFITDIKKANIKAELNFVELEAKIKNYKDQCLKCSLALRRQTFERLVENEEEGAPIETNQPDKNDAGVLYQLIDNKIKEIKNTVQANIESIFKELNDTVNDKELVQKTIESLEPILETVKQRVQKQGENLRQLMNTVPQESIDQMKKLHQDSQALVTKISDALAVLEKLY